MKRKSRSYATCKDFSKRLEQNFCSIEVGCKVKVKGLPYRKSIDTPIIQQPTSQKSLNSLRDTDEPFVF
jgi:hypothetical protein